MGKSLSLLLTSASLAALCFVGIAQAGTALTVLVDRSQLMQLSTDPGTVVVGNPSMADVSLNGRQLFIHGHSVGETNLMVFDQSGEKIADYDITVTQGGENAMTVFKGTTNGTQRFSYACAPICEHSMMVGDDSASFNSLIGDNGNKTNFKQGIKASAAPSAAPLSSSNPGH